MQQAPIKSKQLLSQAEYENLLVIFPCEIIPHPMSICKDMCLCEKDTHLIWPNMQQKNIMKFLGEKLFCKSYEYLTRNLLKEIIF